MLPLENAKFCALLYANDLLPGDNLETINKCNGSIKKCHRWPENSSLSCTLDTLTAQEKAK